VINDSGAGIDDAQVTARVAEESGSGTDSIGGLDVVSVIVTDVAAGSDEVIMSGPTGLTKEVTDSGSGADELVFPFKILAVLDSGDGTEVIPIAAAVLIADPQICIYPRNFGAWTGSAPAPTAVQNETGVEGAANIAWTLGDDSAVNTKYKYLSMAVPNNSNPAVYSVDIKKDSDETRFPLVFASFSGCGVPAKYVSFGVIVNTKTGALLNHTSAPTNSGIDDYGDWWRVWISKANNNVGNNSLAIYVYPAWTNAWATAAVTAATGTVIVDAAQVELNASSPSAFSFPAYDVVGGLSANAGMADTGAGTDATPLQASGQVAESGSGTDSVYGLGAASVIVSDTAEGTDSVYGLAASSVVAADSATGADTVYNNVAHSNAVIEDTGSGTDVTPLGAVSQVTDSGSGTDTIFGLAARAGVTDSAAGSDTAFPVINPVIADSAVGTEARVVQAAAQVVDSFYGDELIVRFGDMEKQTVDFGTGAEALIIAVVAAAALDSGIGVDATLISSITVVTDSGTGADKSLVPTASVGVVDSSIGAAVALVTAFASVADAGFLIDLVIFRQVAVVSDSADGADGAIATELFFVKVIAENTGFGADEFALNIGAIVVFDSATSEEKIWRDNVWKTVFDSGDGTDAVSSVRPYEAIWMVSSRTAKIVADSHVKMDFGGASAMSSRVIAGLSELMIQRAVNER
jgi:hypothetical protein